MAVPVSLAGPAFHLAQGLLVSRVAESLGPATTTTGDAFFAPMACLAGD